MLTTIFLLVFTSAMMLTLMIGSVMSFESRPKLPALDRDVPKEEKKRSPIGKLLRGIALLNKPLCIGALGQRIANDLNIARVDMSPEQFMLVKELAIGTLLIATFPKDNPDMIMFYGAMSFAFGYMLPEFWLKGRIKKVKQAIIKELPDTIDLLALCVNAGLDFMLALKWVVEKSRESFLVDELNLIMQEINVGKPRRTALSDFAKKYNLPDVSTFTRTLIQADRMGTSVADALNILSEDMRLARFRRGEQIALKAPMKMLIPLLFFIFPVVAILVGAPIFLDFLQNNPLQKVNQGIKGSQGHQRR